MLCLVCGRETSQVNGLWLHKEYDATHKSRPIPDDLLSSDKIEVHFSRMREDAFKEHYNKIRILYDDMQSKLDEINEVEGRIIKALSEVNYAAT